MPPPLGAYENHAELWPFATLYREMARLGLGPAQVKSMLLWEAGAVLGVGFPDSEEKPEGEISPTMRKHIDWLLARQRGENIPAPKPDRPSRAVQESLMSTLGGTN